MNYEPFLNYRIAAGLSTQYDRIVCDALGDEFGDITKVCAVFFATTSKLSREKFFKIKRVLREVMGWLFDQGLIDEAFKVKIDNISMDDVVEQDSISKNYFKSLDDALDFVSFVGGFAGLNGEDDLLQIKSIVICSWFGAGRSDMIGIQKSDVDPIDKTLYIASKKQTVSLTDRALKILRRCSETDVCRDFPSGRTRTLMSSRYLLRSMYDGKLSVNSVSAILKRFNRFIEELELKASKIVSVHTLRDNYVFCQMKDTGEPVENIVDCEVSKRYWYLKTYKLWVATYYPAQENSQVT